MILQFGAFLGGLGNFLKTGLEAALPTLKPLAGQVLGGFADVGRQLLQRELARPLARARSRAAKAQLRQASNLAGQTPAIPSTTAVATGGRVFRPPLLVTNVIPPGPAPPVLRPIGLRAGPADRIASRVLKGIRSGGVLRGAALRAAGPIGLGISAISSARRIDQFGEVFPKGPSRMFLRNGGTMPQLNGRGVVEPLSFVEGGPRKGMRIWQRTADGCNVQHFTCDPDTGQMAPIEQVADAKGLNRFRLDLATQKFIKLNPRRMNPLNFRAASRARSRTSSLLRIVRTMFTEHRREKTGKIRPKARRKKK